MLSLKISSALFASTSLFLAIFIPIFGKKEIHIIWAFFNLLVAAWGFCVLGVALAGHDSRAAEIWWRIGNIVGIFIASLFCQFIVSFTEYPKKTFLYWSYFYSLIFSIFTAVGWIDLNVRLVFNSVYYTTINNWLYAVQAIVWIICIAYGHWILYKCYRNCSAEKKIQTKYLFIAFAIGFLSGGASHWLIAFGFVVHPAWNALITVYSLLVTYAIFKHALFDIRVIVKKTMYYTLFATSLSLFYLAIVFSVYILFVSYSENKLELLGPLIRINKYSILPFFGTVLFLSMHLMCLLSKPRSKTKLLFSFLCLETFVWQLMWLLSYYMPSNSISTLIKIAYVGIVPLPFTFFHFLVAYIGREFNERKYLAAFYIMAALLLLLLLITNSLISGYRQFSWGFYPYPGPAFTFFVFCALFSMVRGLLLVIKDIRTNKSNNGDKNRLYYLFAAFILYSFCALDFFQVYGFSRYPIGSIFFILSCIVTLYAIIRHDLLPVKIALQKTITYSALTFVVSIIYLSLIAIFYSLFVDNQKPSFFANFIGILFIALTFKPFELRLQRFLEKLFFKGTIAQISFQKTLLENELERRERLKSVGILAAGMAHEIRNPLTSIKTFAEYLPKKYDDPEFRRNFSRIVLDEVDRINNIVKQLLEFSKPAELNLKAVLLSDIIEETLSLLSNNLLNKNILLEKRFDRYTIVMADRQQLKQAFLNLFLNSIQAIEQNGTLAVSCITEPNGYIRILISDTGYGISKDNLEHIFDPFFTTKGEGTGLGMSIVHGIISKHGGKIAIRSEQGIGTEVSVFLKSQS